MINLKNRLIRVLRLEEKVFSQIKADKKALPYAVVIVAASSLAAGVGILNQGLSIVLLNISMSVVSWLLWLLLVFWLGRKIFPGQDINTSFVELARTTGFSSLPGVIRVTGLIPGFGNFVYFAAGAWMLAAMVISVKSAFGYSNIWKAFAVSLLGWFAQLFLLAFILTPFIKAP